MKNRRNVMQLVDRLENTLLNRVDRQRKGKRRKRNMRVGIQTYTMNRKRDGIVYHENGLISWTALGTKPPNPLFGKFFLSSSTAATRPESIQLRFENLGDRYRRSKNFLTPTNPDKAQKHQLIRRRLLRAET